jgi:transposase-like protein
MRNIIAKLPRLMQAKMQDLVTRVFQAPSYAAAMKRGRDLVANFKDRYLRSPEAHHRRIRSTNRLERLNGESRRRTKVIPRFPTERSCLTLLYASLMAASKQWRGIPMTAAMIRQLSQLRAETTPMKEKEEAIA